MPVRKAVIPAAGLGTRFLPATKAVAKEMIPVVDRPGIQYAVEEAARAGIEHVLIVTARGKGSIEDHFDRSPELESHLEAAGKSAELEEVKRIAGLAEIHFVRQLEPAGFGHAVLMGSTFVGDEAFAVLVPDEVVPEPAAGERDLLRELIGLHDRFSAPVLAVQEVPHEDISSYGSIDPEVVEDSVFRVKNMIEKPSPEESPSDLASRGRYVFTPDIFDAIRATPRGVGGEIQLTDAIRGLIDVRDVYAYAHQDPIYDVGKKLDFVKATIELALRRDDLAKPLKDYLSLRTEDLSPE